MQVIDLSSDVAGRFATKLLAMSGLKVIRPAAPARLEGSTGTAPLWVYLDAHKKAIPHRTGAEMLALVAEDDVVFSTFDRGDHVGEVSKLVAAALPSSCVHVMTSSFGASGPYSAFRGGPLADWAAGGYLAITGDPDREPLIGPENLCGYIGGYTAAIAAEAAMQDRRRTGEGQRVDISTMEAMLSVHQSTFSRLAAGIVRARTGRYTETYPLVVRPCRDGYVSLGVVSDAEFDRLSIAIGRTDLITDYRFRDKAARWTHRDELDAELATFLETRDGHEVVEILGNHGVAAAKVAAPSEILRNAQLARRRYWEHPNGPSRSARMPGNPVPASTRLSVARRKVRPKRTMPSRSEQLPLAGVVVLDFTTFWAGPSATRWLADLGASVVWVERPRSRLDVSWDATDISALVQQFFHLKMNRNKQSVVLDLSSPADREIARGLAREADVLIENFRPGVMERFGLGPSELCRSSPSLVYVSLSGFGSNGPWSARRSYGPTIEAASSIEGRTGYRDGEPLRLGHTLPDGAGGLAGALAALRGLRERSETGIGGWTDISQLEVYTAICGEELLAVSTSDQRLTRIGNRSRYGAVQGVFPCRGADEWIAVRLVDGADLDRLADVLGIAGLVEAGRLLPRDDDAIEQMIGSTTVRYDKYQLAWLLQEAGLEAFPVLKPPELLADRQLVDRQFFVDVPFDGGLVVLPGTPLHSDRQPVCPAGPAPRLGQHTAEILHMFGLDAVVTAG